MNQRKVVVTGIGTVTPLGKNVKDTWENILKSKSGISVIPEFSQKDLPCKIAGQIKLGKAENELDISKYVTPSLKLKISKFIEYGLVAAHEAIEDSNILHDITQEEKENIGVYLGSGIGELANIQKESINIHSKKRVNTFFIPSTLVNLLAGNVSIKYGFCGPNLSIATACSTGAHCIGEAARIIKTSDTNIMIAGSSESAIVEIGLRGFSACFALTSKFNDNPQIASRPWDKNRSGFVMSEGGACVILEEYEHAKKRGAKIYAEIAGYGISGDAYHITSPHPEGKGAKLCMKRALKDANITPEDIDYINAHSTSTVLGDLNELLAVQTIFSAQKSILMSSTKSALGHMLGASGSTELILCIMAMKENICPPTINLDDPIKECKINLIPNTPIEKNLKYVMTNSFGFGGTNASLIIKKQT